MREGKSADLIVANNVLAHVPHINDFVSGVATLLKPEGVATFEVHHLLSLMQLNQYDTICHEHFSYLSVLAARRIFLAAGLRIFDVECLPTHGGSIRMFVCHESASHTESANVAAVLKAELQFGLKDDQVYLDWAENVRASKLAILKLLIELKQQGKSIVGYGAPAKGVTLLNYCGVGPEFLEFTVDKAPSKQNKLLPGVHIPILAPAAIYEHRPDYILILPWNLKEEIMAQMAEVRSWGCRFIVPIPAPVII